MTLLVDDDIWSFDLARALEEISPERRAYAQGYRFERDRRLSVAAYRLLKEALAKTCGITGNPRLSRGANGKPYLTDHPGIHFNLSHCPCAAACAVSDRAVGVDIEGIAPFDESVARRVLSEAEFSSVRDSNAPEVEFVRYWTQKEALVKMTGKGLEDDLLRSLLEDARGIAFETSVDCKRGYVLTVAQVRLKRSGGVLV